MIQEDFPRTPSPVFAHGNGHGLDYEYAHNPSVAQAISLGQPQHPKKHCTDLYRWTHA
jgi:hypothetical protein